MRRTRNGLSRTVAGISNALALAFTMVLGLEGSPASASYYSEINGSIGSVSTSTVEGRGLYVGGVSYPLPGIRVNAPTISRSPAWSGKQVGQMVAQLQVWNGSSWTNSWTNTQLIVLGSQTFAHADNVRLPAGDYRIVMIFGWYRDYASSSTLLGAATVILGHATDYRCVASSYVKCQVGNGWVSIW